MPRIRSKRRSDPFSMEVDAELYRNKGGAFIKNSDGTFTKVGGGRGKYSIRIRKVRKKKFF